jgi:hypothetical protein
MAEACWEIPGKSEEIRQLVDFVLVTRVKRSLLACALLVALPGVSEAQARLAVPELVTDRPDFTESSEVVGHGVVQIESGLTFERTNESLHQVTVPLALARIGVGSRFEVRIGADGIVSQMLQTSAGRVRTTGHSDLEIGAKVKFLDADRGGVDMAVIPILSVPLHSDGFSSEGYDPGFKITAARDLPRGFGLSANFNAARVTTETGRVWEREASLSLGRGIGGPFGAYWEIFGSVAGTRCDCTVNTGLTVALSDNHQVDVEVGRGISGDAQDWFVGVGFAVRRLRR